MKKKTLKLSLETLRRLDLDVVNGGMRSPSIGIICTFETEQSRGMFGCTLGPQKPRPRSLGPSCGIICL